MNILVTGAKGFVGKNLVESLKCIRDKKDKRYPVFADVGLRSALYCIKDFSAYANVDRIN